MVRHLLLLAIITTCIVDAAGMETNFHTPTFKGIVFDTRYRGLLPQDAIIEAAKKGPLEKTAFFCDTIREPEAAWIRVFFKSSRFGKKSRMEITSLLDGSKQTLDSIRLSQWENSSAFFNGDAVRIELFADEEELTLHDELPYVEAEGILFSTLASFASTMSFAPLGCNDQRTPVEHDPFYGRLINGTDFSGGTAWICANGALLTAAHCFIAPVADLVEFNVPYSSNIGEMQHPSAEDQYYIDPTYIPKGTPNMAGLDWAIFQTYRNTETNLLPYEKQSFMRVSTTYSPITDEINLCGYGRESADDPGYNPTHNYMLQQQPGGSLHFDDGIGMIDIYNTFSAVGASGTAIWLQNIPYATSVGVFNGSDIQTPCVLRGTTFKNTTLASKLNRFPFGASDNGLRQIAYLDANHPSTATRDGTILKPYATFAPAYTATRNGGLLIAAPGTYTGVSSISGDITITSPGGVSSFIP